MSDPVVVRGVDGIPIATFSASLRSPTGLQYPVVGIWSASSDIGILKEVQRGDVALGTGGAKYNAFGAPTTTDLGTTAFAANLTLGGAVNSNNDKGIWKGTSVGGFGLVAREGELAAGTAQFGGLAFGNMVMNNAGLVAFKGHLKVGTAGVNFDNDTGVWAENFGGGRRLVAREGDIAPETGGLRFESFHGIIIGPDGQVAFAATLRGAGVNSTNNSGIWAEDSVFGLRKVARRGDAFLVAPGDLRTINHLRAAGTSGGGDGRPVAFNAMGRLAFGATFTNNTGGVFVAMLP
jgi:hypothetical protein